MKYPFSLQTKSTNLKKRKKIKRKPKQGFRKRPFFLISGITLFFILSFLYKDSISYYTHIAYYKLICNNEFEINDSFLIRLPEDYSVHGIDVSAHQQLINWKMVKQMKSDNDSLSFVFIKATEGKSMKDKYFSYNWTESKKQQLIRGAYHFYLPGVDPKIQASNFIATVKLHKGDLPPVLDIEKRGRQTQPAFTKDLIEFLNLLEKEYRVKPIIYTNLRFYEGYLSSKKFKDYPFWLAHYYVPNLNTSCRWHFWQHNDHATINGIKSFVDINSFNGNITDLHKLTLQ